MKNKRALLIIYLIFLIGLIGIVSVFAHSGRTDANGGHWDRKNGTYHYHSGVNTVQPSTYNYSVSDDSSYSDNIVVYNDRYDEGYEAGYSEGESFGIEVGYDDGYDEGHSDGYNEGLDDGYDKGHKDGYNKGYAEGQENGFEKGKNHQTPMNKFLTYYTPISIIGIIILGFKAFSK